MEIKTFIYRRPSYLPPIDPDSIDTIVIHHTGNNNDIHTNTDYHMDSNRWSWLGYGYYCHNGMPLKVRGYENQNAAVKSHNHHTVNIAVQGNYDKNIPSINNIEAVQECIYEILEHCPNVKYLKGHRDFNDTSCPGKLFPLDRLKLEKRKVEGPVVKYATVEDVDKLMRRLERIENKFVKLFKDNTNLKR